MSRPTRSARALFTSTLLYSEALVVMFAALVAFRLELASVTAVLWGGIGLALWALVAGVLVRRSAAGYVLGSMLQLALVATGIVLPMMFALGGVFAILWLISLRVGGQIDRERVVREREEREHAADDGAAGPTVAEGPTASR